MCDGIRRFIPHRHFLGRLEIAAIFFEKHQFIGVARGALDSQYG